MTDGVHPNAPYAYHGCGGLQELLQQKNQEIEFYRFRGLNQAKKLLGKTAALSEQKRLLMAIASGEVQRVNRIISIGLQQKKGAWGLLASVLTAAQGHYRPKSYTEEEDMKALLIWRLSGNRVAGIYQKALGGPSVSYLRTRSIVPPIIPSCGQPMTGEVKSNVQASLETCYRKEDLLGSKVQLLSGSLQRARHRTSLEFINEGDLEELFRHLNNESESEKVHYAGEATVGALGILCKDHHIYPARPVLVSGDCKCETGEEYSTLIQTILDGIDGLKEKTKLCTVSIASDGESRRGSAFILLTFKQKLSVGSPIYHLLHPLKFLDLHVGDDDLTWDKDWKHVFKCFHNLLLRQ
ncbi:hypothetical protein CPB84DRAFT_1850634 [Gymnopilus junonius]|uniref:Uncharacterized protein n=1 Tax=Gymnopilus junonius TaxID=109634 RepID=A0A9P5NI12_GYMJU|nr:hypothetical protein CPB84DRAFT_1850634 [Gymnopilus junonius]